jgi:hypothetical protein
VGRVEGSRIKSDKVMINYLLGELSEKEAVEIERTCLEDSQYFEELLAIEAELTDDYMAGALDKKQRDRYERRFLINASQERLHLSEILIGQPSSGKVVSREAVNKDKYLWVLWKRFQQLFTNPQPIHIAFATITVVVLLVLSWSVWRSINSNSGQIANTTLDIYPDKEPLKIEESSVSNSNVDISSNQNRSERNSKHEDSRDIVDITPSPSNKRAPSATKPIREDQIAILALISGGLRDEGTINHLKLSGNIKRVRLIVGVDSVASGSYQLSIQSIEGREIIRRIGLQPKITGSNSAITIEIPANSVPESDYIATLSLVSQSGNIEEVSKYFLRITYR